MGVIVYDRGGPGSAVNVADLDAVLVEHRNGLAGDDLDLVEVVLVEVCPRLELVHVLSVGVIGLGTDSGEPVVVEVSPRLGCDYYASQELMDMLLVFVPLVVVLVAHLVPSSPRFIVFLDIVRSEHKRVSPAGGDDLLASGQLAEVSQVGLGEFSREAPAVTGNVGRGIETPEALTRADVGR